MVDYVESTADSADDEKIKKAEKEAAGAEYAHSLELTRLTGLLKESRYQQLVQWLGTGAP